MRMRPLAIALFPLAALASMAPLAAASDPIVPALGSYLASGSGDPATYAVRGQVKRNGGRRSISVQVRDTCGGLATFANTPILRTDGVPTFSARVGAARISGRWIGSTRVAGSVRTPCGRSQGYTMHRTG